MFVEAQPLVAQTSHPDQMHPPCTRTRLGPSWGPSQSPQEFTQAYLAKSHVEVVWTVDSSATQPYLLKQEGHRTPKKKCSKVFPTVCQSISPVPSHMFQPKCNRHVL